MRTAVLGNGNFEISLVTRGVIFATIFGEHVITIARHKTDREIIRAYRELVQSDFIRHLKFANELVF